MTNKEWFRNAGYGMMIHWGLYSVLGGEWQNKRIPIEKNRCRYGEWAQSYFAIPNREYEKLAAAFNPVFFNAEEIALLAKDAGMKYLVMTSKHHDGFAMYHSKADKYNVVDATPFGRDVCAELGEACYKHGLKFGLYYSQDLDWHEPDGGGYKSPWKCAGSSWDNNWDFPNREEKCFDRCFEKKILPQVEEILTGYGDLVLIWFDVPMTITKEQSRVLYDLVKKHQPDCLINSRIGYGMGDYTSTGDNEIPSDYKETLYESACTLNDTWGYLPYDDNWKDAARIREIREHLNARGINYLLNIGPDALGRVPEPSVNILRGAK